MLADGTRCVAKTCSRQVTSGVMKSVVNKERE